MEQTIGRIKDISVLWRRCTITAGPLAGEKGRVTGEIFSPEVLEGPETATAYHTALTVETPVARVTLSPLDIALQDV